MTKLQARLVRSIGFGGTADLTTPHLAKSIKLNGRAVRRALKQLQAAGVVRQEHRGTKAPAIWSLA